MSTDVRDDGQLVAVETDALLRELERLRVENGQLSQALETRIVIEQAKGILAERFGLPLEQAFTILRHAARGNRMKIHELAAKVIADPETPAEFGRVSPPHRAH